MNLVLAHAGDLSDCEMNFFFVNITGIWATFFLGGWGIFAWKIFRQRPKKNCYANLQNYFTPLNPPSKLLVEIPDFGHFISLDRMNSRFLV